VLRAVFITRRMCESARERREWSGRRLGGFSNTLQFAPEKPSSLSRRVHVGKRLLIQFHSFHRAEMPFPPIFRGRGACVRTERASHTRLFRRYLNHLRMSRISLSRWLANARACNIVELVVYPRAVEKSEATRMREKGKISRTTKNRA
jgi:hypothetical protein